MQVQHKNNLAMREQKTEQIVTWKPQEARNTRDEFDNSAYE